MITKETSKRAAKILAAQKRDYKQSFEAARGDSKAIAKAAAEYREKYGRTPQKRWANALSQATKAGTANKKQPRRPVAATTSKPTTPNKAPTIKPLGGFVLTKTGKLCTDEKVVSEWGSKNLKTWKRIYEVHIQEAKQGNTDALVFLRYVLCANNGQYYVSDCCGFGTLFALDRNSVHWNRYIHPAGDKEAAFDGKRHREYTFRDINEAFYFAQKQGNGKAEDCTKHPKNLFHQLIKDMYESEYDYAQYPKRRGVPVTLWNDHDKPQLVQVIRRE